MSACVMGGSNMGARQTVQQPPSFNVSPNQHNFGKVGCRCCCTTCRVHLRLRMLKLVKVVRTVDLHLKRLLPFCSFVRAVPHKKRRVHQERGSCAARDYNFGFRPAGSIFSLSSPALSSLWRERQDPQVPRSVSGRVWQGEQEQHESHFHSKVVSYSFIHMGSVAWDMKCITQWLPHMGSWEAKRSESQL